MLERDEEEAGGCSAKLPSPKPTLISSYREEFQKNRSVNKKDFAAVEYLLRKGQRQLEIYSSPGIRNIVR
ncbi:hypothetical protein FQN54_000683 [Arachnomyces sp. PD_36]|nr:hypothetical protein FQN54_000683 [Arachnomyces sp. PD_36]